MKLYKAVQVNLLERNLVKNNTPWNTVIQRSRVY